MTDNFSENYQNTRFLKVLSYNIHRSIGISRRKNIIRIATIIRDINPDIAALQEVENTSDGAPESEQLSFLAAQTGMQAIPGPTLLRENGNYGNAVLSRLPIGDLRRHDISYPGQEPRGALDLELFFEGINIRVIGTHLGLKPAERRNQIKRLHKILQESAVKPVILMGDMNEWLPRSKVLHPLLRDFGRPPLRRTFPAIFPIFPLDRIYVSPPTFLTGIQTVDSRQTRTASDHLPLLATLEI